MLSSKWSSVCGLSGHRPMTLHSPTENIAVINHKILEANSQVQNVKIGGHQNVSFNKSIVARAVPIREQSLSFHSRQKFHQHPVQKRTLAMPPGSPCNIQSPPCVSVDCEPLTHAVFLIKESPDKELMTDL
ncbi:hypothetical protein TNCV_4464251 [Trichonephila clavipes]|nr:hypothetical protein TNCV_4464251 [Trichonephila clavipes]